MKPILSLLFLLCILPQTACAQKSYRGDGPDDVLRFLPLATAVTLKACGTKSRSTWPQLAVATLISHGLTAGTTWGLKHSITAQRPDHTDFHSFPSGHAAIAFTGATMLHKEFYDTSPWISVGGYAVAAAVSVDRVVRHRHRWQDVGAGAAIGVGGTLLGYWLTDKIFHKNDALTVVLNPEGMSFAYCW